MKSDIQQKWNTFHPLLPLNDYRIEKLRDLEICEGILISIFVASAESSEAMRVAFNGLTGGIRAPKNVHVKVGILVASYYTTNSMTYSTQRFSAP